MLGFSKFVWGALLVLAALGPSPASAQPARARDFLRIATAMAPSRIAAHECQEMEGVSVTIPERVLTPDDRAGVLGRVMPLGPGRNGALVRIASGHMDANGDLAYDLKFLILSRVAASWVLSSAIALDSEDFLYERPTLLIGRAEDSDDDGEQELLFVIQTSTEVECGTGYCTRRQSVVLDPNAEVPVLLNLVSQELCQAETLDELNGTVLFRDVDRDGHRDVVLRTRMCPGATDTDEEPACSAWQETPHLWQASSDTYS